MNASVQLPVWRWRHFLWRHPESPVLLLSAAAWLLVLLTTAGPMKSAPHPMAHHAVTPVSLEGWPALLVDWPIMLAAMMFPALVPQVRVVAMRSFWSRRNRSVFFFLAGYTLVWLLYAIVAAIIIAALERVSSLFSTLLVPLSLLLAALWQLTPQKRRSLVACHFTMPLAPTGWRADLDCSRYGMRTALLCCVSCWALMLVCVVAGHSLWPMLVVTVVSLSERVLQRPRQFQFALALLGVALAAIWQAWPF
jgi:predicted metal-binding membrane protein